MNSTSLQFTGDWNLWLGLLAAGAAAAAAWFLYRRETYKRSDARRWLLPALRAAAIFLVVLALTGPVLHHEKIMRELGRLFVFVDSSQSMDLTDEEMPPSRKVASMQAMGILPQSDEFKEAQEASAHLAKARRAAENAIMAGPENEGLADLAGEFADDLGKTFAAFEEFSGDAAGLDSPARGFIAFQRWNGDNAGWVFDRSQRRKGDTPDPSNDGFLESFEFPSTTETSFAVWIRGYLHPPKDGKYRFWISSDDRSELSLSNDEKSSRTERAARVSGWNEFRDYDAGGEQKSKEFDLKAGRRYYVEALLEAGSGSNFLSVAWQVPGEERSGPIPGSYLSPYVDSKSKNGGPGKLGYFRENLLVEAEKLRDEVRKGKSDPFKVIEKLRDLDSIAAVLRERTRAYVLAAAARYHANNKDNADYKTAVARFDRMTRKQRIARLLLDEDTGVLGELAEQQDIELVSLRDGEVDPLWWQRRGGRKSSGEFPTELDIPESGSLTNLSDTVQDALGKEREGVGVIVLTDGRHNSGSSPIAASKTLGELGVPFFPVGIGADKPPQDMALTGISAPETVFARDRVKGEIILNDFMKPGIPYKLRIAHDGKTVWEEEVETNGSAKRAIEYDFAVQQLVEELTAAREKDDLVLRSMPLFFTASVLPAGGNEPSDSKVLERVTENNEKPFYVQAVTQPRKVLLIDGRPRWESRYLKNLFERDERWEVNALMQIFASSERTKGWRRGTETGMFPATQKELNTYSMIVIGDVPARLFREEEMEWIADFTSKRGGGLIFIDGYRQNLKKLVGTKLGKLLPVEWVDPGYKHGRPGEADMPKKLVLTRAGKGLDAMRFVTASLENEEIWDRLHPPHWVAPTLELPGSEVLANTIIDENRSFPAFVWRRYGAGRVLYCGIDEVWRWRYNVADRYHQKFWVQMTNWVSEKPFAVEDKYVSISADKLVYDPGRRADIRVRIRDEKGQPVTKGDFAAVIYNGTDIVSEIELESDANYGGIFRGRTGELEAGNFEIAIREKYFLAKPKEYHARAEFVVRDMSRQELDNLSLDDGLLAEMAQNSGGQFFYEEETRNLVDLLESIDRKKVISSHTNLWSSYWWFAAIITLLTAEWILRKRSGYV